MSVSQGPHTLYDCCTEVLWYRAACCANPEALPRPWITPVKAVSVTMARVVVFLVVDQFWWLLATQGQRRGVRLCQYSLEDPSDHPKAEELE